MARSNLITTWVLQLCIHLTFAHFCTTHLSVSSVTQSCLAKKRPFAFTLNNDLAHHKGHHWAPWERWKIQQRWGLSHASLPGRSYIQPQRRRHRKCNSNCKVKKKATPTLCIVYIPPKQLRSSCTDLRLSHARGMLGAPCSTRSQAHWVTVFFWLKIQPTWPTDFHSTLIILNCKYILKACSLKGQELQGKTLPGWYEPK